jgi:hypothetical protein
MSDCKESVIANRTATYLDGTSNLEEARTPNACGVNPLQLVVDDDTKKRTAVSAARDFMICHKSASSEFSSRLLRTNSTVHEAPGLTVVQDSRLFGQPFW